MLLIVEDDPLALSTTLRLLRIGDGGASHATRLLVHTAPTAAQGLDSIMRSGKWAGFLIDVDLPDGEGAGLELLKVVRRMWPNRPAVLLASRLDAEIVNAAFRLGASVLAKPASQEDIDAFLDRVSRRA